MSSYGGGTKTRGNVMALVRGNEDGEQAGSYHGAAGNADGAGEGVRAGALGLLGGGFVVQ